MQNRADIKTAEITTPASNSASTSDARWPLLTDFELRYGRPLRVLHIGNIANNAYRNALIQRAQGVEADVVCYDYYHIMGCPEWDSADISGDYDPFLPDWWALDVGNWPRPDWFVQGPQALCLNYLRAKHRGDEGARVMARLALVRDYADRIQTSVAHDNHKRIRPDVLAPQCWATTARLAPELANYPLDRKNSRRPNWKQKWTARFARICEPSWRTSLAAHTVAGWRGYAHTAALAKRGITWESDPASFPRWRLAARYVSGMVLSGLLQLLCRRQSKPTAQVQSSETYSSAVQQIAMNLELAERFKAAFPTSPIEEIEADLSAAKLAAAPWADVLPYYDIVQGYSVDAAIPLFAGHPAFACYEHGTIRLIPFEDSRRGRLCRFVYQEAPKSFITNSDVLPSADRIPIAHNRRVLTPHAFNDAPLHAFSAKNPTHTRLPGPIHLFSPTRHHWRNGDTSWLKGNDIFLRAAGRFVGKAFPLRITLVKWGQEVSESMALVDELGLTPYVTWVPILNRHQLWHTYNSCDAVVDQFTIPALGGVGFEALTLGARVITRIDESSLTAFFGQCPPVLNAATIDEVYSAITSIIEDPSDVAGVKERSRIWAQTYHSTHRVLQLEFEAYSEMLELTPQCK